MSGPTHPSAGAQALPIQQPAQPAQLVLLFHGVGSNARSLEGIGQAVAHAFPQATVVAIDAPHSAGMPGAWQWFSVVGVTEENRQARVDAAMPAFSTCIAEWQQRTQLSPRETALIGFSQGAIMALESTKLAQAPAGRVVALSGRFATLPEADSYHGSVHLLHGKEDPVISYQHAIAAAHRLRALGTDFTAEVRPFVGHEVPQEFVDLLVERLTNHVSMRIWNDAVQGEKAAGTFGE